MADPIAELDEALDDIDRLLKKPEAGADLAAAGVNVSLALTLTEGLRAYVHGDKDKAIFELGTAVDEIAARRARGVPPARPAGSS